MIVELENCDEGIIEKEEGVQEVEIYDDGDIGLDFREEHQDNFCICHGAIYNLIKVTEEK